METIARIRRGYFVQGKAIKAISRELKVSCKVVRKVIHHPAYHASISKPVDPTLS